MDITQELTRLYIREGVAVEHAKTLAQLDALKVCGALSAETVVQARMQEWSLSV